MNHADTLERLSAAGVSFWLDGVSRGQLVDRSLTRLIHNRRVTGVTLNTTGLAQALTSGSGYDEQLRSLAVLGAAREIAVRELMIHDARSACDLLSAVNSTSGGYDGLVLVDIDPRLAHDSAAIAHAAQRLWCAVDRPNLLINIPSTEAGLRALPACLAQGISVGATLLFSAQHYAQAVEAFWEGMERALASGHDINALCCVASFSLSPVDSAIDALLDRSGTAEAKAMRGTAALAHAQLIHARHQRMLASPRWHRLARHGALPPNLLWVPPAATHKSAPPDTRATGRLLTPGTMNALPEHLLKAVAQRGEIMPAQFTDETYENARIRLSYLKWFGVSATEVRVQLDAQGIRQATSSWHKLLDTVTVALGNKPVPSGVPPSSPTRGNAQTP